MQVLEYYMSAHLDERLGFGVIGPACCFFLVGSVYSRFSVVPWTGVVLDGAARIGG